MRKQVPQTLLIGLIVATLLAGTAFAQAPDLDLNCPEAVESFVEELTESDCYKVELFPLYHQYKEQKIEILSYTVEKGDTLIDLAKQFGVSLATITESNKIKNPNLIYVGQQLTFPAATGLLYTVEPGDELEDLADYYEVEYEAIWFANSLYSSELIPGAQLVIPGAKLPDPFQRCAPACSRSSVRGNSGLLWPLAGRLTSRFGMRNGAFHGGIDIACPTGTPIYAAAAGTVVNSCWHSTYGYMVTIKHDSGYATLYAHASKLKAVVGDVVSQGDVIALVGSTGRSTGPHLHFEVSVNGRRVNPLSYLP